MSPVKCPIYFLIHKMFCYTEVVKVDVLFSLLVAQRGYTIQSDGEQNKRKKKNKQKNKKQK